MIIMKKIKIFLTVYFLISIFLFPNKPKRLKVKKIDNFYIKNNLNIKKLYGFNVYNNRFYILDRGDKFTLKVFNKKGELVDKFGRLGGGPGEVFTPVSFAVNEKYCLIYDLRTHSMSVYKKNKNFIFKKRIKCSFEYKYFLSFIKKGTFILGTGENILPDGKGLNYYSISLMNLLNKKETIFLPSYLLYNKKNPKQYYDYELTELRFVGKRVYCSYCKNKFFAVSLFQPLFVFVEESNIKKNIRYYDKKIKFVKLQLSRKIKKLFHERKIIKARKILNDKLPSLIKGLFCINNNLGLVYTYTYIKKGEYIIEYRLKIYNLSKKETLVSIGDFLLYKNKKDNIAFNLFSYNNGFLYMLEYSLEDSSEEKFIIYKFKITD